MARRLPPTDGRARRASGARPQNDTATLAATHLDILDTLALARDQVDDPRDGLTREELFERVAPGIWGHAAVVAARRAGLDAESDDELVRLGQRPYFERCLQHLLDEKALAEDQGLVKLAKARVRVRGQPGPAYLPGLAKLRQRRRNLMDQATAFLQSTGGKGLKDLFPPMSPSQFEELVLSMVTEGYDETKPIVRDVDTKEIIDGFHRFEAAKRAGIEPQYEDRPFANDLQRIRFAIRSNLIRPHVTKSERDQLASKLAKRHLSTPEISRMLGRLPDIATFVSEQPGTDADRRTRRSRSTSSPRAAQPRFGKSAQARWVSVERKRQAEDEARAMHENGVPYLKIGELLCQKYALDQPLAQGTVYTMVKAAEHRRRQSAGTTED